MEGVRGEKEPHGVPRNEEAARQGAETQSSCPNMRTQTQAAVALSNCTSNQQTGKAWLTITSNCSGLVTSCMRTGQRQSKRRHW
jgi:hypothetical protein